MRNFTQPIQVKVRGIEVGVTSFSRPYLGILLMIVAVATPSATPIQPDLKKLLSKPHAEERFVPARAGWNGPESSTKFSAGSALEKYSPEEDSRAARASLIAAATPDPRVVVCLAAAILLLRRLRQQAMKSSAPSFGNSEVRRAA